MAIDEARLMEFMNRFVGDLGATMAAGNVVVGERLGLYTALAAGPMRPQQLAERTGTAPRYIEEWLRGQAAGGYVEYDAESDSYSLTEEQALALTNPHGPVFVPGAFQLAVAALRAEPQIAEAFRTGAGVGWHSHDAGVFDGCERFFRPGYSTSLIGSWLPALDGVEAKLSAGARVADVGCGHGASSILMASEFPRSTVIGSDSHAESIATARKRASEEGLHDRMAFEVASAQTFTGGPFDLVTTSVTIKAMLRVAFRRKFARRPHAHPSEATARRFLAARRPARLSARGVLVAACCGIATACDVAVSAQNAGAVAARRVVIAAANH